mmetsp:Transcript_4331/g.3634  ORF Transcript_4331/g.3634 Transcript_4331/m.3634 type:complete len:110 (-) Transcript_4331:83-412(-)
MNKSYKNKSHRKSAQSLNISKVSGRDNSKKRLHQNKLSKAIVGLNSLNKSPAMSRIKVGETVRNIERNNTELVPLRSARTIYYPQNFKKFKKKKIKLIKKTPRGELDEE